MYDFIKDNQLNIMLGISSICMFLGFLLLITRFLTKRRKRILISMELVATFLLLSDRHAYLYSGDVSHKGYVMVRVSNFLVFFLTSAVVHVFNAYIKDLIRVEAKSEKIPIALRISGYISALGMILAVVSAFTGLYYRFDEMNVYHRGPGFLIAYIIPVITPIIQFFVVVRYRKNISRLIYTAIVLYIFVPITAGIIQIFIYGLSLVNIAMVMVSVFLYIFTYIDMNDAIQKAHEIETMQLKEDRKSMKRLFDQTSTAFVAAIEKKDAYPPGHSQRAAEIAMRIGKAMGKTEDEIDEFYYAALMHNVGVMGIPYGLLVNADKLSPDQQEVVKKKPLISEEILSNIKEFPFLCTAAKYCCEKYDGTGYPEGLKGEEIPEIARVMAAVDKFDAMTTKTTFSNPLPYPIVREEFIKEAGLSLDPGISQIMVDIIDEEVREQFSGDAEPQDELETELICKDYREAITLGVVIEDHLTEVTFTCEKNKNAPNGYSAPSIIIFDSYDRRVHDNLKAIDAYKYMEYGEVWFDGNSITTEARKMQVEVKEKSAMGVVLSEGSYKIVTSKYEDHIKIIMYSSSKEIEVIIALPDGTKYASVAITGENCTLKDITVNKTDIPVLEGDIPRIAEEVSYIDRLESDLPNVQVDRHRAAYTEPVEIDNDLKISFHTMSLPAANLVWHCPYVVIYSSKDGTIGGEDYKEYSMIKLNGEIDKNDLYASNNFVMKRMQDFPGWNTWKEVNKTGLECELFFTRKGNVVTMKTTNLGVSITNTTTLKEGDGKAYVVLTGDMVALTDIRIK